MLKYGATHSLHLWQYREQEQGLPRLRRVSRVDLVHSMLTRISAGTDKEIVRTNGEVDILTRAGTDYEDTRSE